MIKLIQDSDLDGKTIRVNPETLQVEVIAQQGQENSGENSMMFTEREGHVDTYINGMQFLFREIDQSKNKSNVRMCITGVKVNGTWYGDSPDAEPFTDPFTGETIVDADKDGRADN